MKLGPESPAKDLMFAVMGVRLHEILNACMGRQPRSVLEVGAGSGKLSLHYALRGSTTVLLDPDPDMNQYEHHLARAAAHLEAAVLDQPRPLPLVILRGDGRDLSMLPDAQFELVWNEGVLEHFTHDDQVRMLREMTRTSSDWVAFQVPDADYPDSQKIAEATNHHYHGMPAKETPLSSNECVQITAQVGLQDAVIMTHERFLVCIARKYPGQGP